MPRENVWKNSLFNCFTGFDSPLICFQGCFCPCWLYGDNNHVFRQQGCCGPCCCGYICCPCTLPWNAGALRTEIRHKYDIRRGLIPDWMVHTFCCPCGWCQEAKEMQGRPVGLYIPPHEIQGKVKKTKGNKEMSAPETQLVASGRLASASEADSAQHIPGMASDHVNSKSIQHTEVSWSSQPDSAVVMQVIEEHGLRQSYGSEPSRSHRISGASVPSIEHDTAASGSVPTRLSTIVSGVSASGTPSAAEMHGLQSQVQHLP